MPEKAPLTFREAPEVEAVALTLIRNHHLHLSKLKDDIKYLFRSEPEVLRGSECLATASKISGLKAFLAGSVIESLGSLDDQTVSEAPKPFFLMQVWMFGWSQLTKEQQIALVDHELCHFGIDDGKLTIIPHDLEEFKAVVHRHGFWRPDVAEFVRIANESEKAKQLGLNLNEQGEDDALPGTKTLTISGYEYEITVDCGADEFYEATAVRPGTGEISHFSRGHRTARKAWAAAMSALAEATE